MSRWAQGDTVFCTLCGEELTNPKDGLHTYCENYGCLMLGVSVCKALPEPPNDVTMRTRKTNMARILRSLLKTLEDEEEGDEEEGDEEEGVEEEGNKSADSRKYSGLDYESI